MQQHKSGSAQTLAKPGTCSLLLHILQGAFTNGMQLPAVLGIGLSVLLHHEQYPYHEAVTALLICGLLVIGLVRGCIDWQDELTEYHRDLALMRHQSQLEAANRGNPASHFVRYNRR